MRNFAIIVLKSRSLHVHGWSSTHLRVHVRLHICVPYRVVISLLHVLLLLPLQIKCLLLLSSSSLALLFLNQVDLEELLLRLGLGWAAHLTVVTCAAASSAS